MDDGSIRRSLVPTDFSPDSMTAFEYAVSIAREHQSEIVLVHVTEPLPRGAGHWCEPSTLLEQHAEAARAKLELFEKRATARYPRCRSELHFGVAPQVIAEVARRLEVELIVVAARPRTGLLDRLFEGLPEKLMHTAPCPVLAVQVGAATPAVKTHPFLASARAV